MTSKPAFCYPFLDLKAHLSHFSRPKPQMEPPSAYNSTQQRETMKPHHYPSACFTIIITFRFTILYISTLVLPDAVKQREKTCTVVLKSILFPFQPLVFNNHWKVLYPHHLKRWRIFEYQNLPKGWEQIYWILEEEIICLQNYFNFSFWCV